MNHSLRKSRSKLRSEFLKRILYLGGFKIIRDHWVYVKSLSPSSIVLDIGANTGSFSKSIINMFNSKCYAVEPNKILLVNHDSKLTILNAAITITDGPVKFFISENPEASSLDQDFQNLWKTDTMQVVEGLSFKTLLNKFQLSKSAIEILKIDIEGAELDLLDNLRENQLKQINQITVEFHHRLNPSLHDRTKFIIKKLMNAGYTIIADAISPSEILFLKAHQYRFTLYQKLLLKLYRKLSYNAF